MADKNPLPWVQYPVEDITRAMQGLPDAAEASYHRLARLIWVEGPLPEAVLDARSLGTWPIIKMFFTPYPDGLSLKWVEDGREKAKKKVAQATKAGQASAEKRATAVERTLEQPLNKGSKTAVEQSVQQIRDIEIRELENTPPTPSRGISRKRIEYTPEFEQAFLAYEEYGTKVKAFEYWQRLTADQRAAVVAAIPAQIANTQGERKQFRKYFEGWINPLNQYWTRPVFTVLSPTNGNAAPPGLMTPEEAEAERVEIRRRNGLDLKWGGIQRSEMSQRLKDFEKYMAQKK